MRHVRHSCTKTFAVFPQFGSLDTTTVGLAFLITFRSRRCFLLGHVDNTLRRVLSVHSSRTGCTKLDVLSRYGPSRDRSDLLRSFRHVSFSSHAVPYSAPLSELSTLKRVFRAKEQTVGSVAIISRVSDRRVSTLGRSQTASSGDPVRPGGCRLEGTTGPSVSGGCP